MNTDVVAQILRTWPICWHQCLRERASRRVRAQCANAGCRCSSTPQLWKTREELATCARPEGSGEVRNGRLQEEIRLADILLGQRILAEDTTKTQPLEDFWETHRLRDNDVSIHPESPADSPSSLRFKPVRGQFTNGHGRNRNISDATALEPPGQTLSPFHPALSLPNFIDTFGPLVFPLYKAALLRKRILLICQAPVELTCNYGELHVVREDLTVSEVSY